MTKIVRTQIPITYITRTNSIITTMKYATPVKTEQTGGLYQVVLSLGHFW